MNTFCEFQEAWAQRFPGCELPQVWAEDITTANLIKHRQKLAALKEELEKVEFYVQCLENLVTRYAETSSSQTVVIKSEENCETDYVLFNESYDSHQECPSVVSSHKRVAGCSLNTHNSVVEKSPEYTAFCSQIVVIKSEENCESDYVLFNESYDSHQECPSVVSSHKRVAGCSLNTQNSVVEKSPEYTASCSQTVVIKSEENCEGDYVLFNESYDSHQECPSVVSSHKRVAGCSLNTQNSVVEKSPEYTASCSQTVVIKSEENCEGDYVLFNESYDSHQECPSVVSSHKRVAGCSLNTQNSVVEKSPEYTASCSQTIVIKSEENCEGDYVLFNESYDSHQECPSVESSHKRDKLVKSVDVSKITASDLTSSVDDMKYNCQVLLCDIFAGRKRKKDQEEEETNEDSDYEKDDYSDYVELAKEDSDYEKDDASDYVDEDNEISDHDKDDDPDYKMGTIRNRKKKAFKKAKKETLRSQKSEGLSSYEKMIEERRAERLALMKSMEIDQDEANEISDHEKDGDSHYEMETIRNNKKKTFKKAKKETLPSQESKDLSSYKKMIEEKRSRRIAFIKAMEIDKDEANEISDHEKDGDSHYEMETIRNNKKKTFKKAKKETLPSQESKGLSSYKKMIEEKRPKRIAFIKAMEIDKDETNEISDDDSDSEMETIRNNKKKTFKKAKKETLPSQESKGLSSYEKMIEEKRAERIALMKSIEIDQIKEGISESVNSIKQLKKTLVKKVHLPSSIEPIRRSNRLLNTEIDISEDALEELTVKNAFQVSPPSSPFEIPLEFSFEDVLESKSPYEKCVNDLSVQKPKCNQEYISYDKAVFENMTLKNFHVRKVVSWKITSIAWYPSKEDLIVAAGDKFGNLNLWKIQDSETTPYLFSLHDGIISNLQFNSFDPVQLITSSFDGTMLCGDLIKHTFNEIYNFGFNRVTWFDFLSHKRLLVSYWNKVAVLDSGTNGKTSEQRHTCSDNLINTVSVHPVNKNIFVTCDSKKKICLWDLRKLQKDPIVEILHHKNTVNSAYFSPVTGNSILTTSIDDSICIFDSTKLTQDIQLTWMMTHNSYGHRFRATWLPHSDDLFAVGFLEQEEEQRKIQIYDKDLNLYHNMKNDNLKTITSVHCFHPYRSALAVDKLTKSVDMSPIAPSNLPSSVDGVKFNCKVLSYDTLAGRKRKNDLKEEEVYKDVKKRILVSDERKTVRNGKKKTLKKATKEALPSQKMKTVRNGKNKTFNKAAKEALPSQKPNGLSSYEKMIEEKRAERIAFMKSMEIYKIKDEISEARNGIKQLKKNSVKKKDSLPSNEPIRRSKRLPNVEVNFSEKAFQELAVKDAFQVLPDPTPFELTFEDVLKTKRPYEECVNDLRVIKSKCTQEYISYDKAVLENMTLKKIHVREVVRERITSVAWYPSKEDLIVAAADKFGNLSLWNIQDSETTPYLFSIHDYSITNMQFNSFDPVQLITSSFDGTMLCGDLIKHTFNEIYNSDSHKVTWFDFLSRRTFLASHSNGEIAVFDMNTNRKTSELRHACHDSMINTVSVHPVNKNIFVTCDCKKSIRLWDLRKLQKDPVVEILHHRNTVISAHFSPVAGNSILSTALDNSICIFDSTKLMQDVKPTRRMNHSIRNTGFKATWLPHSDDLFAVGCNEDRQERKKIQVYDKDLNLYHNVMSDKLKTVTLVECFHPYKSALAAGYFRGRLYVFT